ncbi:MAG: 1-phosphofructokinase [Bacteroides sp.]|nr:1-phosphofructokinase [Bacteroides sp.]MCM1548804.1 1-phosphofructokinase [Clostridium sp.]
MIYTVTFNPSLDYIVNVENFTPGRVNRTSKELIFPGGKGINVSIVLQNLGLNSTALGFIAGFTGRGIQELLHGFRIREEFIPVPIGLSRINVKLRSSEESEINGMGPDIDSESLAQFYTQLEQLSSDDVLVLAGSIPQTLPDTIYRNIMERIQKTGIMVVVDATKELLCNVLEFHPFLIKPNNFELGEIFGLTNLRNKKEVIQYAKRLQERGARNVLVSMAGDGAVLVAEDGSTYESPAPEGKVVNSVGAGDSMVAGFLYGYLTTGSYEQAFYYGISCGSASAFSENLATKEEVTAIYQQIAPKK